MYIVKIGSCIDLVVYIKCNFKLLFSYIEEIYINVVNLKGY